MTEEDGEKLRGKGRGSRFFVLGRQVWNDLQQAQTANRLHLYITFLVLLAGTGSDQRLTKWSLKACEEHAGLGKPRARRAIEELVAAGLVERVEGTSKLTPQYRLPDVSEDENPIFLPVQLVTGFSGESPVIRRLREGGDAGALKMLIDLYGLIEIDSTYAVPIAHLCQGGKKGGPATKVAEMGVHALWAVKSDATPYAAGSWSQCHSVTSSKGPDWSPFWERLGLLEKVGALWYEPWLFDSPALDAEPLFPLDYGVLFSNRTPDETAALSRLMSDIGHQLLEDRPFLLDRHGDDLLIPLPLHHQEPCVRGVAKLRIEPDSPGWRLGYARRKELIAARLVAYERLQQDISEGRYDRPIGAAA